MIRLNELKQKKIPSKYYDFYKVLYSNDIDYIIDTSVFEPKKDFDKNFNSLCITLGDHRFPATIIITTFYSEYLMRVEYENICNKSEKFSYQKCDFYSFKNEKILTRKLDEILKSYYHEVKS
ncbi:MAG: hypothetical protein IJ565_06090 [Bacilli bacterium]|nr:hypothetical protein [Bacilli bacterium]